MLTKLFNKSGFLQNKLTFYPLVWFGIGLLVTFLSIILLLRIYFDSYLMDQTVFYRHQIAKDIIAIIEKDQETVSTLVLTDTMRDLTKKDRLLVNLERLVNQNKNFIEAYIVDQNGSTIAAVSLLKAFSKNYPSFKGRYIYQKALHGNLAVSGWGNLTEKYCPYWYMSVPIEKYPGKVVGVLIVTINIRRINDAILTSQGAKYGDPILIDRNNMVLVHLNQSRVGKYLDTPAIIAKLKQNKIGTLKYHDEQGKYVLTAYQRLDPYGWGLIVQIPPDQIIYIIRNKLICLFALMALAIFMLVGALTYLAAGNIVLPIKRLTQASFKFGKDHNIEYFPVEGNDEIAQLSAAFYDMQLRIQDFEKQRALYISMIAHELRNPFLFIKDNILSWSDNYGNENSGKLQAIRLKLEQVNRMIVDLLEFSHLDLDQVNYFPEVASVKYAFEDVITGYGEQQPKFVLRPFSEKICVWVDPVRLQQVIQNIFDNCLKYTPAEALVFVDCAVEKDMVRIEIADQGSGIPEELLADFFKPFRTGSQLNDSYGLGMAITQKLVIGMKGEIDIRSYKNQGTVFTIKLPQPA